MSEESGQIARSENGTELLFRFKVEDLTPASLERKFAFQMKRSPKREEWIARSSANIVLWNFYLKHLEDYERMFTEVFQIGSDDYSKLPEEDLVNIREREKKNQKWLDSELPESLNALGQKISSLQELKVLFGLLRSTQRMIARRQVNYSEFDAQLSFFSEPMKMLIRIGDELTSVFVFYKDEFEVAHFSIQRTAHIRITQKRSWFSPPQAITE